MPSISQRAEHFPSRTRGPKEADRLSVGQLPADVQRNVVSRARGTAKSEDELGNLERSFREVLADALHKSIRGNEIHSKMHAMLDPPTFRSRVLHRTTAAGGHRLPILLASFRPDLRFPFDDVYVYGAHFLSVDLTIAPGETFESDVFIRTAAEVVLKNISVGMTFGVMEGQRQIADGVITAVYPQERGALSAVVKVEAISVDVLDGELP